jgi:hypothetical protein
LEGGRTTGGERRVDGSRFERSVWAPRCWDAMALMGCGIGRAVGKRLAPLPAARFTPRLRPHSPLWLSMQSATAPHRTMPQIVTPAHTASAGVRKNPGRTPGLDRPTDSLSGLRKGTATDHRARGASDPPPVGIELAFRHLLRPTSAAPCHGGPL